MKRRDLIAAAGAAAAAAMGLSGAEDKAKLLLPSDKPDEFGFRLMWYSPVPPIDQAAYRLKVSGLVDKPLAIPLAELRKLPHECAELADEVRAVLVGAAPTGADSAFGHLLEIAKPKKTAKAVRDRLRRQVVRVFHH